MAKPFRTWIYHATEEPKIICSSKFEVHKKNGWADSPAKFAKIKDFGIDENDPAAVQVLGESIEGVKDRLNGELNIKKMNKDQLEDFALKHFNINIDKREKVTELRKQVNDLLAGNEPKEAFKEEINEELDLEIPSETSK